MSKRVDKGIFVSYQRSDAEKATYEMRANYSKMKRELEEMRKEVDEVKGSVQTIKGTLRKATTTDKAKQ